MTALMLVTWLDSAATADWMAPDRIEKELPLSRIESAGWLMYEDEERLVIAASRGPEQVGEIIAIPQAAILSRHLVTTDPPSLTADARASYQRVVPSTNDAPPPTTDGRIASDSTTATAPPVKEKVGGMGHVR